MKRLIYFFLICFLGAASQDPKFDSLKRVYEKTTNNEQKVKALSDLIAIAPDGEFEKYNDQMRSIVQKQLEAISKRDPLYNYYLKYKGQVLDNDGLMFQFKGENKEAMRLYEESMQIREEVKDSAGLANLLNNMGGIYQTEGDYNTALQFFNRSLPYLKGSGNKSVLSAVLNNIGLIYDDQGNIAKGLEYYLQSLKLREEMNDEIGMGGSYNNLAVVYENQGINEKALEYYLKSMKMRQRMGDKNGLAVCCNNLGSFYAKHGKNDSAMVLYKKGRMVAEEAGNQELIAVSFDNIAKAFSKKENYDSSRIYYLKALELRERLGMKKGIPQILGSIALCYMHQKNHTKALEFGKRSYDLANELKFPEKIRDAAKALKAIYTEMGNYKEALKMYDLFITMRDSVANKKNKTSALKQQLQYEFEMKEAVAKAEQKSRDILAEEEKRRQALVFKFLIAGIAFVSVLFLLILRGYRNKRKANIIISRQKEMVEEKQKEILDSINYAHRIQKALITSEKYIDKNLVRLMRD